jgi:hypothetical protein
MTRPTIIAALSAGLIEPCVILDDEGREVRGYRPTERGGWFFAPTASQRISDPIVRAAFERAEREYGQTFAIPDDLSASPNDSTPRRPSVAHDPQSNRKGTTMIEAICKPITTRRDFLFNSAAVTAAGAALAVQATPIAHAAAVPSFVADQTDREIERLWTERRAPAAELKTNSAAWNDATAKLPS